MSTGTASEGRNEKGGGIDVRSGLSGRTDRISSYRNMMRGEIRDGIKCDDVCLLVYDGPPRICLGRGTGADSEASAIRSMFTLTRTGRQGCDSMEKWP